MKILIIDDEEHIQKIFTAFLMRYGQDYHAHIDVTALNDPRQGLAELRGNGAGYDLILLDLRMPKLCGAEIFRTITAEQPALSDKILMVTGYPGDLPPHDVRPAHILEKPFRYSELVGLIRKLHSLPAT